MIVIGEDNFHSVSCNRCGHGTAGRGILPESYVTKLIEDGYIRQIGRRPALIEDLTQFFTQEIKRNRSAQEMAGDLMEKHEVFAK